MLGRSALLAATNSGGPPGFGVKYANPSTQLSSPALGVAFSPDESVIAIGSNTSPFIHAYQWSSSTGFGTKYANPSSSPGNTVWSLTFSVDGNAIIATNQFATIAYQWSSVTGFGTRYTDASSPPAGSSYNISLNKISGVIARSGVSYPYVAAYPFSSASGFGTIYSQPATVPDNPGQGRGCAFSNAGDAIATTYNAGIPAVYQWSSGFGARYSNPATAFDMGGSAWNCVFSPADDALAFVPGTVYKWSSVSGFGTKYANLSHSCDQNITFHPSGNVIAGLTSSSPYVHAWPWSYESGAGTKYANPATLPAAPTGAGHGISFSPSGKVLVMGGNVSPFISAYPFNP